MAKFAVMASELKSLKKSMEDRKLAELKKEIIEILKKQDEKDFKKAIDYFESQELHFTHLEKSLVSGKWIEKAGYGVGTVRIWKGKKYKKIAPGKWARVFDKEGRGTNIAIGKLIARVNKIDNAEDLLQFVMENKQRFIDEDGRELGILDKVRAAVDTRNEKLSGESSPYVYGVGENVNRAKNEMFSKKDKIKKEEADLHKVSRKLSQIPTTELKQEKARLERAVANKTRSKRDSLNNTIFRESNQEKLDAINKELEKRSQIKAEKTVEDKIKENPDYPFKPKTEKERAERAAFEKDRDDFIERMDKIRQENKKKNSKPAEKKEDENKTYWIQDFEGNRITSDDAKKKIKGIKDKLEYMESMKEGRSKDVVVSIDTSIRQLENYRDDLISKLNPEDRKEIERIEKENKKKESGFKKNPDIEIMDSKVSQEEVKDILDKYKCSKEFAEYVVEQNEAENREPIDMGKADELREYSIEKFLSNFKTPKEAIDYAKKYDEKMVENGGAGFDWKIEEYCEEKGIDINKQPEGKEQQKIDMQMQLLELNKNRQDNNKNIKKLNSKLAELKQKKAEDESRGNSVDKYDKEIKDTQKEIDSLLDDNDLIESKGTKIAKELNQMEKDGVKKSMFDDFVIDMFIDDEIEDEEELKAGETEYNDYSAEHPELFNSTSMKVREALDRIRNQVL